jgi:hypothetical protein
MTTQDRLFQTARLSAAILSLWAFIVPSCSRSNDIPAFCKDPGTSREMYFAFDDSNMMPGTEQCFGPSADCMDLCIRLAQSECTGGTTASVDVCERVPSPDGWADAGYQGLEDAGYVSMASGDMSVDPNRILHVVFRMRPFCGT